MSTFDNGNFRIARGSQWLGTEELLVSGDQLTISGVGQSSAQLTVTSGRLASYTGELKFRSGASRAVGKLASPNGGFRYHVAAEMIGAANSRSLRLVLIRLANLGATVDEEESGGEWEGDEEP